QADKIRRQSRAGQAGAFTLDAQAHRVAQGRRHFLQPGIQTGQRLRDLVQGLGQGGGLAPEAQHLEAADGVDGADQGGDRQGQAVLAIEKAGADPGNNRRANQEGEGEQGAIHGWVCTSCLSASTSPRTGCNRTSSSARRRACSSPQKRASQPPGRSQRAGSSGTVDDCDCRWASWSWVKRLCSSVGIRLNSLRARSCRISSNAASSKASCFSCGDTNDTALRTLACRLRKCQ